MGSLTYCLKKYGSHLSDYEVEQIKSLAGSISDEGYGPEQANVSAVEMLLEDLDSERADIVKQITDQGGSVPERVMVERPKKEEKHAPPIRKHEGPVLSGEGRGLETETPTQEPAGKRERETVRPGAREGRENIQQQTPGQPSGEGERLKKETLPPNSLLLKDKEGKIYHSSRDKSPIHPLMLEEHGLKAEDIVDTGMTDKEGKAIWEGGVKGLEVTEEQKEAAKEQKVERTPYFTVKKAVIPEGPIKAPTTGKQESLLGTQEGETFDLFGKKEEKKEIPEPDRDSFTIDRIEGPVTFSRGEYIKAWVAKDRYHEGEINGISHANKEYKIGNIWYPFGTAYKTEEPIIPKKKEDLAPLSEVIESINVLEKSLEDYGLKVTKTKTVNDNDVWEVSGDTKPYKDILGKKGAGGSWYGKKQVWSFYKGDPTDDILKLLKGKPKEIIEEAPIKETTSKEKVQAKKFRILADKLQKQIDVKRNPAISQQNLTARRARIAEGMSKDADRLENIQNVLRGMADDLEEGNLDDSLKDIKSKAQVEYILTRKNFSYPDFHKDYLKDLKKAAKGVKGLSEERDILNRLYPTGWRIVLYSDDQIKAVERILNKGKDFTSKKWIRDSLAEGKRLLSAGINNQEKFDKAKSLLEQYVKGPSEEVLRKRKIKKLESEFIGQKIEGFFPTPKTVVRQMLDMADIQPGMKILEPSAGKGDIADLIKEGYPDAYLKVIEWLSSLRDILETKGHEVIGSDFLEHEGEYDRIIQNPPFEKGQDIDHVRHAYDQLKPGGKLVSIMSTGPFFRNDKKSKDFREWFEEVGGDETPLDQAFKGAESFRQTGVSSKIIIIDKLTEAKEAAQYSRRANRPSRTRFNTVTLQDVRDIFKGQNVGIDPDGSIWMITKKGQKVNIYNVDQITPDEAAFEVAYNQKLKPGQPVTGSYFKGNIKIQRGAGDKWTLAHESVHFMEDMGILNDNDISILSRHIQKLIKRGKFKSENPKDPGGAEDRATFIADQLNKDQGPYKKIQQILNKIREFIDRLVNLMNKTADGIVREIESGKIFERGTEGVKGLTPAYEAGKIPPMQSDKGTGKDITPKETLKGQVGKEISEGYPYHVFISDVNKELPEGVFVSKSAQSESAYLKPETTKDYGLEVRFASHTDKHPVSGRFDVDIRTLEDINLESGPHGVAEYMRKVDNIFSDLKPFLDSKLREVAKEEGYSEWESDSIEELLDVGYGDDVINSKDVQKKIYKELSGLPNQSRPPKEGGRIDKTKTAEQGGFFMPKDRPQYSKASATLEKDFQNSSFNTLGKISGIIKDSDTSSIWKKEKTDLKWTDLKWFDVILSTPLHYAKKIPAFQRMFDWANKKIDMINEMIDRLTMSPEGKHYTTIIRKFKKRNPDEYKIVNDYRIWQDKNQYGYRVFKNPDTDKFDLYEPEETRLDALYRTYRDAKRVAKDIAKHKKIPNELMRYYKDTKIGKWRIYIPKNNKPVGSFEREDSAKEEGLRRELSDFQKKYNVSDNAVMALEADKRITNNGFNVLMQGMRDIIAWYQERGLELPKTTEVIDGEKIVVDLRLALQAMGDRWGYYFPRNRKHGAYVLTAKQKGKSPFRKEFDLAASEAPDEEGNVKAWKKLFNKATPLGRQVRELRKQGYKLENIQVEKSKRTLEDVFVEQVNRIINIQTEINDALQAVDTEHLTLEKLGIRFADRMLAPGDRVFSITGSLNKEQRKIIKEMGGQWFSLFKGEPKTWNFKNPGPYFERRLAKALFTVSHAVDQESMNLFAKALVESIADLERGRGHRAHMISRNFARGEDVTVGYEEDLSTALTSYAAGIAGGEAKKHMALKLMQNFLGTDISWDEYGNIKEYEGDYRSYRDQFGDDVSREDFEAINDPDAFKENAKKIEELKEKIQNTTNKKELRELGDELSEAYTWLHDEYRQFVQERKIDDQKQSKAWRDGKSYIQNMLRNDEPIDRIMGTIKGVAVFKYLAGRVSAPVINLTALPTIVPAAMNTYAKIPIPTAMISLGKGLKSYGLWKAGKHDSLSKDEIWALDQITKKKWDAAKFNREALGALESKLSAGLRNVVEKLMIGFSASESLNRGGTIMGAYKAIKAKNPKMDREDALKLAKEVSDKSHSVYNKANWPRFIRGTGVGANLARSFYVFRSFSHNYLLTMKDAYGPGIIRVPQNKAAFAWLATAPAMLAGTGALVGKELIVKMLEAFGVGGDDPEEAFYTWVAENFGERGETVARYGIFGIPGVNLKGSLEIGIMDIPTSLIDVLGAPGSMLIEDPRDMYKSIKKGAYLKAMEKTPFTPLFLANPFRAYREYREGVTTATNQPVFYGNEPLMADIGDAIARFFSFNPVDIAGPREKQWKERKIIAKYQDMRSDIYAKFKKQVLNPSGKSDYIDLLKEVNEYNKRVISRKLHLKGVPLITPQSIRANLKKAFRPPKIERLRAMRRE